MNFGQEMVHTTNYSHVVPGVSIMKSLNLYEFVFGLQVSKRIIKWQPFWNKV